MIANPQTKPLLSRVADSVYWMGRYIERAENVARFLDVNHNLMLDLPQGYQDQWQPIVDTTGDRALFAQRYGPAKRESVVKFLAAELRLASTGSVLPRWLDRYSAVRRASTSTTCTSPWRGSGRQRTLSPQTTINPRPKGRAFSSVPDASRTSRCLPKVAITSASNVSFMRRWRLPSGA